MSETVLVTGAGGFVGSAIVRRLVDGGEQVTALLRPGGSSTRLDGVRASVEYADISERGQLCEVLARVRPRAIVHAALPAEAYHGPVDVVTPLRTLLDALPDDGRFVHVGSAWVLAAGDRLDESAPVDPRTPYARNKVGRDALLAEERRVPWINLRLFNLFGRYERPTRLLPSLVAGLSRGDFVELTEGDQVRDFNDVDQVAEAFVHALAAPESACGAVYHVGSGRGTTVHELAVEVARFFGQPELVRFGRAATEDADVPCLVADPRLAEQVLGWHPDRNLDARLREAVEWWLSRLQPAVAFR